MRGGPRPSASVLPTLLRYKDGKLFWRERSRDWFSTDGLHLKWNRTFADKEALACLSAKGYAIGSLFDRYEGRARVVFALHNGYWPEIVDHINGDKADDRIENLRSVSAAENAKNQKLDRRNRTGKPGVRPVAGGYRSQICIDRCQIDLGTYRALSVAIAVREAAELLARLNGIGFHVNHGRLG